VDSPDNYLGQLGIADINNFAEHSFCIH